MSWKLTIATAVLVLLVLAPCAAQSQPGALQPTSGPGGGPVADLVVATDGDLFAVARGLHRSEDLGWSWQRVPAAPAASHLAAGLAADLWAWNDYRLYRTEDDGLTWSQLGAAPTQVHQLAFTTFEHVFAATDHGLFVSEDAGVNWTAVTAIPQVDVGTVVTESGVTSCGADRELYRSEDSGLTWTRVAELAHAITAIAACPSGGYYIGVFPPYGVLPPGGLFHIDMNGTSVPVGLSGHIIDDILVRPDGSVFATSGGWCDGFNWFYQGIYRSADGNAPYHNVGCNGYVNALVSDASNRIFAATGPGFTDIGYDPACSLMMKEDDESPWVRRNRGLGGATIFDLATTATGVVYAAADWTIAWSEDDGTSWNEVQTPQRGPLATFPDGTLLAGGTYRSTDRGRTWETSSNAPGGVTQMAVTPQGIVYAGTSWGTVWQSMDRGASWNFLYETPSYGDPIVAVASGPISRAAFSTSSEVLMFDLGARWSWTLPTTGRLAFAPDEHAIYVATGTEVQRWREESADWMQQPMPPFAAEEVAVDPEGRVYAATRASVRWTIPGDPVWHELGATCSGWYLDQKPRLVFGHDGYLYFGTSCDGVYRSATPLRSPTAVGEQGRTLLAHWSFAPNPLRGASTLSLGLVHASPVDITVYDVRGRLVATLARGLQLGPGMHALKWTPDATTPSGVYTYRIRAGEIQRTGRIVVLR